MQNRYVGDVGDFGKHGLLRFLSGETDPNGGPRFRLGVLWFLTHDQTHLRGRATNGDGQHTGYLMRTRLDDKSGYRDCDPQLWESLRDLVLRDARCVHCVQEEQILPADTAFYGNVLEYPREANRAARAAVRERWWGSAMAAVRGADLVMMDPDNGLGPDAQMYQADGPKFMYLRDISAVWEAGKSIVMYQHVHRIGEAADQLRARAQTIHDTLGTRPIPLAFHRGTARAYFVIPQHPEIRERAARFAGGPWADNHHFDWLP
jgi:hypothetical protein